MTSAVEVKLEILQGRGLAAKDSNGLSDPFCVVKYGDTPVHKTACVTRSLNPTWRAESVRFARYRPGRDPEITVEVWDRDVLGPPEFMGLISVNTAAGGNFYQGWVPLRQRGIPSEEVKGDLQVGIATSPCAAIRCEGPLSKKAKRSGIHQRYFVLWTSPMARLSCFKDASCTKMSGDMDLSKGATMRATNTRITLRTTIDELRLSGDVAAVEMWVSALKPLVCGGSGPVPGSSMYFGVPLTGLCEKADCCIGLVPSFVVQLLDEVRKRGMDEPGVFRLSGTQIEMTNARARLETNPKAFLRPNEPIHNVAGLLKMFLRSLPEPLLTFQLYDRLLSAISAPSMKDAMEELKRALDTLPGPNMAVLSAIMLLLHDVSRHSSVNHMPSANLGIVFGPAIMWGRDEDAVTVLMSTKKVTTIAETIIENAPFFFPQQHKQAAATSSAAAPATPWQMSGNSSERRHLTARRKATAARMIVFKDVTDAAGVERQASEFFDTYDADHSGELDLDEFFEFFKDLITVGYLKHFDRSDIIDLLDKVSVGGMKVDRATFLTWWKDFHKNFSIDDQ